MATPVAPSQPKGGIMSFFAKASTSSSSSSSSNSSSNDPMSSTNKKKSLSWSTPDDVEPPQLADRFENAKSSPAKKGAEKAKKVPVKPKVKADKGNKDKGKKAKANTTASVTNATNTPNASSNTDDLLEEETPQNKNPTPKKNDILQKLFQATPNVKNTTSNDTKDDGNVSQSSANEDAEAKMDENAEQSDVILENDVTNTEQKVVDLTDEPVPVKDIKKDKKVTKKRAKKEPKAKVESKTSNKKSNVESTVENSEVIDISNEDGANVASTETAENVEKLDANSSENNNSEGQTNIVVESSAPIIKKTPTKKSSREKKPSVKAVKSDEQIELELLENLSPEVLSTINIRKEKIASLANEIVALEESVEFNDVQMEIPSSVESLIALALSYGLNSNAPENIEETDIATESKNDANMDVEVTGNAEIPVSSDVLMEVASTELNVMEVASTETAIVADASSEPVVVVDAASVPVPSVVSAPEIPVDILKDSLYIVLARAVQGSSKPLQALVIDVSNILSAISEQLDAAIAQASSEVSVEGPTLLKAMLLKYSDNLILGEEIKTLGAREAYGIRRKNAEIYDCVEKQAIWRWNVHVPSKHLTKSGLKTFHDVSAIRKMYGKLVKAHHDVIKALERIPCDSVKLSTAEEKASKATGEYEKAKEKRREMEQKKLDKLAEKNREKSRKQEEQEIKKREKEEAAAKKAAEKDAETKEREREKKEKEQKLIQEKEKKELEAKKTAQKFTGFFKAPTSAKSSSEVIDISNEKILPVTKSSSFDITKFETSLKANMTMNDINSSNKERHKEFRKKSKKSSRSKKVLNVMVTTAATSFGAESYSELKEVKVDNRMRLLSFYEDHRPAYYGTISRRGNISGRRPFQQDHELLNYDFDSEAEWEEDDGEDIEDSDGDDEEGANELEYDDFFRHDDDFGSDVDDDGDVVAAVAIQKREGEEALGPTFIRTRTTSQIALRLDHGKCIEISQPEKDKNVVRLRMYSAVVFNQDIDITEALESSIDKKAKEVKEKKEKKESKKKSLNEAAVGQTTSSAPEIPVVEDATANSSTKPKKAKTVSTLSLFTDELTITLINEVHNKKLGIDKLTQEFLEKYPDVGVDKSSVRKKINEIAEKKKTDGGGISSTWTVKSEFEVKYNLQLPTADVKVKRKRAANKPKEQQTKITSKVRSPGIDFDKHCEAMSSSENPVGLGLDSISIDEEFLESAKKKPRTSPIIEKPVCVIDDDDNKENILDLDLDEDMVI